MANGKGKGKGKQREVVVGGEQEVEIEMSDRREEVNAFEIVGPKSGRVLKGALGGLIKAEERAEMKKVSISFWEGWTERNGEEAREREGLTEVASVLV